ncbi:ABC transporter permease [Caulobacter sp. 17J80-11]|uniref:ABC transporter permease n=1 Tax=Caulobacter sp. 17J80-11 TaxID=2763502 RepID=UPI0016535BA5|nr:ABC transporter permease [Caulobacter sp. 17J80-11]MBC6983721.1 ABC transporter permease [Caulobacter sp. 17J80-11]
MTFTWAEQNRRFALASHLSWSDIRLRYTRAVLGPWWITLNVLAMVGGVGFVYSRLFGVPINQFLPFFAVGIVMWTFFVSTVSEGAWSLIGGAAYIKDRGVPPEVFVWQAVIRNLIILAHTAPVGVLAMLVFGQGSVAGALMAVPGLILFVLATAFTAMIVAPAAARWRDLIRIIESGLFLLFVVSPVLWDLSIAKSQNAAFLRLNPMLHLLEAWRHPLMKGVMDWTALGVSAAVTGLLGLGALYARTRLKYAAFWI